MHILPIAKDKAERHHWIVKWLRFCGYFICIIIALIGAEYGGSIIKVWLMRGFNFDADLADWLGKLIGTLLGFVVGLGTSLPFWGMSMIIDDLHAIRIFASGYVTSNEAPKKPNNTDNLKYV